MSRKLLFAAMICASLPLLALGQRESAAEDAGPPCCRLTAQGGPGAKGATAPPSRRVTEKNLQEILLRQTKAARLKAGVYVVSRSDKGYKLMAKVSQQGRPDSWYVVDPKGHTVALVKDSGSDDTEVDVIGCMNKFIQNVHVCEEYGGSQLEYVHCLDECWDHFYSCLAGQELRHGANLTPAGGMQILK